MKYGLEVEGKFKGIPTLFCTHIEIEDALLWWNGKRLHIEQVYISCEDYNDLPESIEEICESFYPLLVTLDTVNLPRTIRIPNLSIMLRNPEYRTVSLLTDNDQVKFDKDNNVIVFPMSGSIYTKPSDFLNDVTIER